MNENQEKKANKITHRLIIAEWATLGAILVGCFMFLFSKIERQADRSDEQFAKQTERSDHLYEMFIDLIKETRKGV